ncbi:MAG: arylsulfatase A [Planctomycetota bacterium]|jgi:arylsulfatase A
MLQNHRLTLLLLASLLGCQQTAVPTAGLTAGLTAGPGTEAQRPPNIVILFTDDQGYGDLSSYGHPTIHTPHLDALAAGGTKLTQFYVASPVCSPSRAALLTGCYPKRVGMHKHVIFPQYDYGLHTDEVTLADMLKGEGYATGCFGKWHLGHRPGLLPLDQGFERYAGVPYSNDMAQIHRPTQNKYKYRLPWIEDDEVTEWEPDQAQFTKRTTEAAVSFIEEHASGPFFVYMPFSMPHIPLYASEDFNGNSPRGLYGDVIEEIDWSMGQIQATLDRLGLLENTLVLFTSDNGPWLQFKQDGGSAGLLRGGKGDNWEGGQRVPAIVSWPGTIPAAGVVRDVTYSMDVLPTVAGIVNAKLDPERVIDGRDAFDVWRGAAPAEREAEPFLYYTSRGELAGIRRGPWKLLLKPGELYHLEHDVSEDRDAAKKHPDLVAELTELAISMDASITAEARPTRTVQELLFDPAR